MFVVIIPLFQKVLTTRLLFALLTTMVHAIFPTQVYATCYCHLLDWTNWNKINENLESKFILKYYISRKNIIRSMLPIITWFGESADTLSRGRNKHPINCVNLLAGLSCNPVNVYIYTWMRSPAANSTITELLAIEFWRNKFWEMVESW